LSEPREPSAPVALPAGRVGRPHGLDGSFYVTRPVPRLLTLGTDLGVGGRTLRVIRRAGTDRRPILRLQGVEDREGAESLRGMALTVAGSDAPALGDGEWWAHELEGCEVLDGERVVGTVSRMLELPSCEALEVALHPSGETVLVPMVKDAICAIDVERRRVRVDLSFIGVDPAGER
jgi:16S rRNA processing protein RimM